jgi:hypothetical protein
MGLKKQQNHKGFLPEYWKIKELNLDFARKKIYILFCLYKDRASSLSDSMEYIEGKNIEIDVTDNIATIRTKTLDEVVAYAYTQIKQSVIAKMPVRDEEGNIVYYEDGTQATHMQESNYFADSEDVIEDE